MLNQPIVIGALVATIYILGEIIKHRSSRKNGMAFGPEDRQMLHDLYVAHSKTDADGIPLWYMPRRMLSNQEGAHKKLGAILTELQKMNINLNSLRIPR